MKLTEQVSKYLMTEVKSVDFDDNEVKLLDKAFGGDYEGELTGSSNYSLMDDGSSGADERVYVDIDKTARGFDVSSTYDGDEDGPIKFSDRNIKNVIKKVAREI